MRHPFSPRLLARASAVALPLLAGCGGGGARSGDAAIPALASPVATNPATGAGAPSPAASTGGVANGSPRPGASAASDGVVGATAAPAPIASVPANPIGDVLPTTAPLGGANPVGAIDGTATIPTGAGGAASGGRLVTVNIAFALPAQTAATGFRRSLDASNVRASTAARDVASFSRALQYISPSTTTLRVTVTPEGGSGTVTTGSCTTGTCIASFTATPGVVTLLFELTDGTNTLARTSSTQIIQPSAVTTLSFTANPVVDHVNLALASPTVAAGTASTQTLTVNAYDKANNIIAGVDSFVDASGTPLLLTLSAVNNQAGGTGGVSFRGPMQLTAPGQAAIRVAYDGKWLDNSVISVASSRPLAGALGTATLTTTPTIVSYACGCSNPVGIVVGSDRNLWVTGYSSNAIVRMTPTGATTPYATSGTAPHFIVRGPDGNVWFTELGSSAVGRITTSGAITEYAAGSNNTGIAVGGDGALWFGNSSGVGRITVGGAYNNFPTGYNVRGVGRGPDGNIWFLGDSVSTIGRLTPAGTITTYPVSPIGVPSDGLVTGPDGNIWFVENGSNKIGRINQNGGGLAEYSVSGTPRYITVGPDGNLWATLQSVTKLARITTTGFVTEYAVGGSNIITLTAGPDGNIWYTSFSDNTIGKFVL